MTHSNFEAPEFDHDDLGDEFPGFDHDDSEEPMFDEAPEFDRAGRVMVCTGMAGNLLLEVFEIEAGMYWELSDQYGRVHFSNEAKTEEEAVNAAEEAVGAAVMLVDDHDGEEI